MVCSSVIAAAWGTSYVYCRDTTVAVAGAGIVDIGNATNLIAFALTTNQLNDPRTTNIQRHHTTPS